jgi:hypothetical protein
MPRQHGSAKARAEAAPPAQDLSLKVDETGIAVHAQIFAPAGEQVLLNINLASAGLVDQAFDASASTDGVESFEIGGVTYLVRTAMHDGTLDFQVARQSGGGLSVVAAGQADAALVGGISHGHGFDAIQSFLASSMGSIG